MTLTTFGPLAFFNLGAPEVIVILIVALLLFGHRLPQVARAAGRSVVEFKRGLRDVEDEVEKNEKSEKSEKAEKSEKTEPGDNSKEKDAKA